MIREKIIQLYKAFGVKYDPCLDRGGWITASCVLAPWLHEGAVDEHPSFAIKESKGLSVCKCFSCGHGGELVPLLYRIRGLQKQVPHYKNLDVISSLILKELEECEVVFDVPDYEEGAKVDEGFPEEWLKTFKPVTHFPEAMQYLEERKVSLQVIAKMDVRYDPMQRRIGFPFRSAAGTVMGVQGRAIDNETILRYYQYGYFGRRNSHVWLGESWMDFDKPLVLCEGPFDAARIMEHYLNVVASFTSGLSVEKIKRIRDASEIITFYDYGKGGDAARAKLEKTINSVPIWHIIPNKKENDPGDMSNDRLRRVLEPYVQLSKL